MRNKHDVLTNSISPPPKKSKINRNRSVEPPKKKEKVAVEEMDVPDKVFGGLKKPTTD